MLALFLASFFKNRTAHWFVCLLIFLGIAAQGKATEGILDYDVFRRDIEPMLTTTTYTTPANSTPLSCFACHGFSTQPAYGFFPLVMGESRANFTQVAARVTLSDPDTSLILLKPLGTDAGGTTPHDVIGNKQFPDTQDLHYLAIINWIYDATRANQGARISRTEPHPNPFRFSCDIVYFLTTTALRTSVTLYTESGYTVKTFTGGIVVGANRVTWDGRDEDLEPMPTGVYFYRVRSEFDDGVVVKTGSVVYTP